MANIASNPATNKPITDKLDPALTPVLGSIKSAWFLPSFSGARTGASSDLFVVMIGVACVGASGVAGSVDAGTTGVSGTFV